MRKKALFSVFAISVVFLVCCLTACLGGATQSFTTFKLETSPLKDSYYVGQSCEITIYEDAGSPMSYSVYTKANSEDFVKKSSVSKKDKITVIFEVAGTFTVKVVPVVSGVEQTKYQSAQFTVKDGTKEAEEIVIKNNVIDLYNGNPAFNLSDLEIVYTPEDSAVRPLTFTLTENENLYIKDGILVAKKYIRGAQPYVVTVKYSETVSANLYVRICAGPKKYELKNFMAGFIDRKYAQGEFVAFQCMAFPDMAEADIYNVYRKIGNDYVTISPGSGEIDIVTRGNNTYYLVKVVETGAEMNLRFNAVINGVESSEVYAYQTVSLSPSTVAPSAITVTNGTDGVAAMLLNDTLAITADVLPINASKSFKYTCLDGSDEFISVSSAGVVTSLKATLPDAPAVVRVTSAFANTVFFDLEIHVLNIDNLNVAVLNTEEYSQKAGEITDVTLSVSGLAEEALNYAWTLGSKTVSTQPSYTFVWENDLPQYPIASSVSGKVKITLTNGLSIERTFTFTLLSIIDIAVLPVNALSGSEIELEYTLENNLYTIRWEIYSGDTDKLITGLAVLNDRFIPLEAGSYYLKAIVSNLLGADIEEAYTSKINVSAASHEISSLEINGYYDEIGGGYAPLIKWNYLGDLTAFTVEVLSSSQTIIFSSSDMQYSSNFNGSSFRIPYNSEYAALSKNFSVRIKTDIGNRYTPWCVYVKDSIVLERYPYLGKDKLSDSAYKLLGGFYFKTMKSFSDMLNYMLVFKPSEYYTASDGSVSFNAYFEFTYDALKNKELYERDRKPGSSKSDPTLANAEKLVLAAFFAYGRSDSVSISSTLAPNGGVTLSITAVNTENIDQVSSLVIEEPIELDGQQHYAAISRDAGNEYFPILSRKLSMNVSSGRELLLAVELGFKPVPVPGSAAKRLYDKACAVLNRIIATTMTNTEKAHAIFDYLASEIVYDKNLADEYTARLANAKNDAEIKAVNADMKRYKSFYLEGVFDEQVAVCEGISKAFVLLCGIEEIPAVIVSGEGISGSSSQNHAWNMVMLNGEWYCVDATWGRFAANVDDQLAIDGGFAGIYVGVRHFYFGACEDDFTDDHINVGEFPGTAQNRLPVGGTFNSEAELAGFVNSTLQPLINTKSGTHLVTLIAGEEYTVTLLIDYLLENLRKASAQQYLMSYTDAHTVFILIIN